MTEAGHGGPLVGGRVMALRKHLGLSQERLAEQAGIGRIEIIAVEKGRNKASTNRMRKALARGFGLCRDVSDAYIDGHLDLQDVVRVLAKSGSSAEAS